MMHGVRRKQSTAWLAFLVVGVSLLGGCDSADDRAKTYYQRGVALVGEGEPIKAALEFRNALKLKSDFVDALFALGEVEEGQGHLEQAAKIYYSVIEQAPQHFEGRVRLAYILLAARSIDQALKYADEARAISKNDATALVLKAAIALRLDNRGDAVNFAKDALKLKPDDADALMILASERMMSADPTGALKLLDQSVEKNEGNVGLQVMRLTALEALGDQPGVETLFNRLIELYPDPPVFLDGLVRWYLGKGRKDEAEKALRDFAARNPDDSRAQIKLVAFLNTQKGASTAIAELKSLISGSKDNNVQYSVILAQIQFGAGEKDQAIGLLKKLVAETEDSGEQIEARLQLARMSASAEDWDEANRQTNAVLAEDPKNVAALGTRAAVYLNNGKNAEAIADLISALNEAPDSANLVQLLGEAFERTGEVALAQEQYSKALSISGNAPGPGLQLARFLLRYGKAEQAERALEKVRAGAPTDREVLGLLAELKLKNRDWVGAQEIAEALRALDDNGALTTSDNILAAALIGLNRSSESISILRSSLSKSGDPTVLGNLVRTYVQAGKPQDAVDLLKTNIQSNPPNAQALVLLGSVYMGMNQPDLAETSFKDAVAVDENGTVGAVALGQFYIAAGRLEEAEEAVRSGLERDPTSQALRFLLASFLEGNGNYEAAIAEYETLLAADNGSTVVANNLASLLSERRGTPAALDKAYEIAIRFQGSEIPQYLDTLGWIHYLRGEYPDALRLLKIAGAKLPNVGLVQYHLGMALKEVGQNALALASLEKAIELVPNQSPADLEKAQLALEQLESTQGQKPAEAE